ncbi:MAG: lipopolysaccharide biosynthesis protein [Candidatus Coprovivens sp.]
MKNKYKYLLKNIGLLTISNFGSKILNFLLIPIYTSILSTSDYGLYDFYNTTISLLIPVLTLNIIESVMRFSLEKNNNESDVFFIGFKYFVRSSLFVLLLIIINKIFNIIPLFNTYWYFFLILYICQVLYDLLSQYSRGIENVKNVAIAGFLNSVSIILFNIIMLVVCRYGLFGYFIANIIGLLIPICYYVISLKIWKYIKSGNNHKLEREMTDYSKPLIANTLSWWINNVSDRYIVIYFCGIAANGIYSLSYKLPSILNIFQSIFSQSWTISAVKEFSNNDDTVDFYSRIYNLYNIGMVGVCSLLVAGNIMLAKVLFAKEFFMAWRYSSYLMISVVFGSLSGFLGGIFSAAKKSKVYAKTTFVGAITNIIFNILLVYYYGPIGASISTLISYITVWIMRIIECNKIIKLKLNLKKNIFSYIILIVEAILCEVCFKNPLFYFIELLCIICVFAIYLKDFIKLIKNG